MTKTVNNAVRYTIATHTAERLKPSPKAIRLCTEIADKRMTADQAVQEIKRYYGLKDVRS